MRHNLDAGKPHSFNDNDTIPDMSELSHTIDAPGRPRLMTVPNGNKLIVGGNPQASWGSELPTVSTTGKVWVEVFEHLCLRYSLFPLVIELISV